MSITLLQLLCAYRLMFQVCNVSFFYCLGPFIVYFAGYAKIGSLVMLIHDVSDVPLDLLRLSVSLNWKIAQVSHQYWKPHQYYCVRIGSRLCTLCLLF